MYYSLFFGNNMLKMHKKPIFTDVKKFALSHPPSLHLPLQSGILGFMTLLPIENENILVLQKYCHQKHLQQFFISMQHYIISDLNY